MDYIPSLPSLPSKRRAPACLGGLGGPDHDSPPGQARTLGPPSSRASKNLANKTTWPPRFSSRASKDARTTFLPGKQELSHQDSPPGQARAHGPSSSRASKNRAEHSTQILLQGKQGRIDHLPPGQARTLGPLSSRASKTRTLNSPPGQARMHRPSSSRASKDARAIFLQGKQEHGT